jgi:hypothetical protein
MGLGQIGVTQSEGRDIFQSCEKNANYGWGRLTEEERRVHAPDIQQAAVLKFIGERHR